jgi:hypothetical protein
MRLLVSTMFAVSLCLTMSSQSFSQADATSPIEIPLDDLVSGKVVVHGKFAVPLGTPMLGRFRYFKKDPKYWDSSVEVTRIVNGKSEASVVYEDDDRNHIVRVYDHFRWTSDGDESFWFYEMLESTWPRNRFPFPESFRGVVNQTGTPGYRTKICIFPAIAVDRVAHNADSEQAAVPTLSRAAESKLPILTRNVSEGPDESPLANASGWENPTCRSPNEARIIASEDIVSGKVVLLGRLKAPVGDILKGDIEYTPSANGQPESIDVVAENSATARYTDKHVTFCDFDGTPQHHKHLVDKGRWKGVNFYEKITWSGVPEALVKAGVEVKRDARGRHWEPFQMRSTLVVCVPVSRH